MVRFWISWIFLHIKRYSKEYLLLSLLYLVVKPS
nr:MAG TPA: hypothetical protein [Caudoviricetes sp.]